MATDAHPPPHDEHPDPASGTLEGLVPPPTYVARVAWSALPGAFGLREGGLAEDAPPLSRAIGHALGGDDAQTRARWKHLASSPASCQAIKHSVMFHHVLPQLRDQDLAPHERGIAASQIGGRFLTKAGNRALLVEGTPRWTVCVNLARHLSRRDGESDEAHDERSRRHDA
eukprot:1168894-Prymnesium_polylepis.1